MNLHLALLVLASATSVVVALPPMEHDANPPAFGELLNLKPPSDSIEPIETTESSGFWYPPSFSSFAEYLNAIFLLVFGTFVMLAILCTKACLTICKKNDGDQLRFRELSLSDMA